ncbi:RHS repeat-associated core domain-containing protein [Kitasatospora indigofera]|uniref:RHS repeat-associated core domain-containing protein n=1 Tax=Kitasatospora indigofera TaxID=67307 RepID=UPI0036C1773E
MGAPSTQSAQDAKAADGAAALAAPMATAAAATPKCAVDRLAENRQVMQPGTAQVSWAVEMAEQGLLTGSGYTRPAGFANLGLAAYAPNSDFARVPLKHPAGDTFDSVPRSLYQAIVAQESNYSQASWHALPGISGGALVGDYYGAGGSISHMDYSKGDCGYGLGQITSGMSKGDTSYSVNGQTKIGVDYQENVAAGLVILEKTWNQLYDAGITVNGGNPRYLENWYLAAWAYNSGIQPTAAFGNTTGCVPSPTCTSSEGNWGLGWANNPRNPDYPPTRAPYLKTSYADASHPASWPYQERIMGWMGQPILRFNQPAYAKPDYHGGKTWLQMPPVTSFCTTDNHCDPTGASNAKYCTLTSLQCWWHQAVTFIPDCATTCATSSYSVGAGSTEPAVVKPHPHPPTCSLDSAKVGNAGYGAPIVVDEAQTQPPLNLVGCASPPNWSQNGTFSYAYGTNAAGDPIGAIDTHQLGAGFGGRILFTHTEDGSNPDLINTGTWTPNLPKLQYYKIKLHLPSTAATATNVVYTINPGGGVAPWKIRVNQNWGTEEWVTIGTFAMQNGGNVQLTNKSEVSGAGNINYADYDVAYDAVAFIPMGGTPGQPIGGPPGVKDAPNGSNPAWVQCGCERRTAGDPVDTSTGYFGDEFTDLTTPGRGLPLKFARTYMSAKASPAGPNASIAADGPFGWGWTYSYNLRADTDGPTGNVTVQQEDGSNVTFVNTAGVYAPSAPRFNATLVKSGSSYVYTRKSAEVFTFDAASGRLTAETDVSGTRSSPAYATTMGYDGSGHLSTITDPAGHVYTLTWSGSHITALSDSAGRTVTYGYDQAGNLSDVWGVGTTRAPQLKDDDHSQFGYTAAHLMNSMRRPTAFGVSASPAPVVSMTYDASERVLAQSDQLGHVTAFTYGPDASAGLTAGQVQVTDPAGHKTIDSYQNGLLISETKGAGTPEAGTWTYTYDPVTLGVTGSTDPKGALQTFTYDDHGNQISASDARGFTTVKRYDDSDHLVAAVDPDGLQTSYGYDEAGHIATPLGGTNTAGDGHGLLTSVSRVPVDGTAPARTTNLYYDDPAHTGDISRAVDANGNSTKATYDAFGNRVSATDGEGNRSLAGYDTATGRITSTVSARGAAAGVTPGCTPPALGCSVVEYDPWGHATKVTDALGHSVSTTYDADGNRTAATDGNGRRTNYSYDFAGRATTVTGADGTVVRTDYNPDGTVADTVDGAGRTTRFGYDARQRKTSQTDPGDSTTIFTYDAAGNAATVKDPAGQVTTFTYDLADLLTSVSYSDGVTPGVSAISYGAGGQRTAVTDGTGTSHWTYDVFGEVVSKTTGAGAVVGYGYDGNGNQTSIAYPGGPAQTVSKVFDHADRPVKLTDWNNQTTTFGFDADDNLTSTVFPSGAKVSNTFDNAGQLVDGSLAKGTTSLAGLAYTRDNAGQLASMTPTGGLPGGAQTYGYTALEQVASTTSGGTTVGYAYDAGKNPTMASGSGQAFDIANRLCWTLPGATSAADCAHAPTGATTYTYDARGNRTGAQPATGGSSTYSYNQGNQLTAYTGPGGNAAYGYDSRGLRASKTTGAVTQQFTWDDKPVSDLLSDGVTSYLYGPDGAPVEQISAGSSQWYFHDSQASTRALLDSSGSLVGAYAYDPFGRVTAKTGTAATPLQFGSGYTDSESGLVYLRARYYDPVTLQFLSVDPLVGSTRSAYTYAENNPLAMSDPTGLLCLAGGKSRRPYAKQNPPALSGDEQAALERERLRTKLPGDDKLIKSARKKIKEGEKYTGDRDSQKRGGSKSKFESDVQDALVVTAVVAAAAVVVVVAIVAIPFEAVGAAVVGGIAAIGFGLAACFSW